MVPAFGVVSGALVLGQPVGWREALALAFVVAALILVLTVPAEKPAHRVA